MSSPQPPAETEDVEYIDYEPKGAALDLLDCHAPEVLIEGPAGTGKTRAILEKINLICEDYPGTRVLICRATRTSLTESVLATLENKVFWVGHPAISGDANRGNRHSYDFPNGSTIVCGSLDKPERLFSTEWDIVYVAEGTDRDVSEDAWEKFDRAMRNRAIPKGAKSGGPIQHGEEQAWEVDPDTDIQGPAFWTQKIVDCNPGAPGHWLNARAKAGKMVRLKSLHADNPSITAGELSRLRSMSGHRRARLYEGRWVAAEGSVYPEFTEEKHVVPHFDIPSDWPWYVWWDPGYQHPTAIIWCAVSPNGRMYFADEIVAAGRSVEEHCEEFTKRARGRNIRYVFGDPHHAFSRTAQSPVTISEQAAKRGVRMIPGPSCRNAADIEAQVNLVRASLTKTLADKKPEILVLDSCPRTIWGFQTWSYKRNTDGSIPAGDDRFEDIDDDEMDGVRGIRASKPQFKPQAVRAMGGNPGRISTFQTNDDDDV